MKALAWLGAAAVFGPLLGQSAKPEPVTIVISGNFQGKLTPCGCTRPMSGGVRRLATLVSNTPGAVWIDTGRWVTGTGLQDQMKAETVADTLGQVGVSTVLRTPAEAGFGDAEASNLSESLGRPWLNESPVDKAGLWIGGGESADQTRAWLAKAPQGATTIWVTDRELNEAKEMAGPRVVVYRSEGSPEPEPRKIGGTWFVSPGSKGKMAVVLKLGSGDPSYRRVELTEEFPDDPRAGRIFSTYLDRVQQAQLIERLPRQPSEAYIGNIKCGACHASAMDQWKTTKHAHALSTLEKQKEDRDPDCLPCHVVGLQSVNGFRDRATTPDLADVGCEACHGPSKKHKDDPYHNRVETVNLEGCRSCHNADNSPGFNPQVAWKAISHGAVEK